MKFLFLLCSLLLVFTFFSGCKGQSDSNQEVGPEKSVEELKAEVLSKAEACGVKQDYEDPIERNSKKFNEEQFKKNLQDMKKNIQC